MTERRVFLVTGASRGIGRASAKRLASTGAKIAVHYNEDERAAEVTRAELEGDGHALFRANLSDREAARGLVAEVVKRFGRLDGLVNNAAVFEDHDVRSMDDEAAWLATLERTLDVNLLAPAILSYHAVRAMRGNDPGSPLGRGRIVNVSSRAAFRGELAAPGYAASKAGLNIFGQSLAQTLAPDAIYVFTIAPGWVETEMAASLHGPNGAAILAQHPLGRVATADEIAKVVAWLALDAPATATGSVLDVNGASYLH